MEGDKTGFASHLDRGVFACNRQRVRSVAHNYYFFCCDLRGKGVSNNDIKAVETNCVGILSIEFNVQYVE